MFWTMTNYVHEIIWRSNVLRTAMVACWMISMRKCRNRISRTINILLHSHRLCRIIHEIRRAFSIQIIWYVPMIFYFRACILLKRRRIFLLQTLHFLIIMKCRAFPIRIHWYIFQWYFIANFCWNIVLNLQNQHSPQKTQTIPEWKWIGESFAGSIIKLCDNSNTMAIEIKLHQTPLLIGSYPERIRMPTSNGSIRYSRHVILPVNITDWDLDYTNIFGPKHCPNPKFHCNFLKGDIVLCGIWKNKNQILQGHHAIISHWRGKIWIECQCQNANTDYCEMPQTNYFECELCKNNCHS